MNIRFFQIFGTVLHFHSFIHSFINSLPTRFVSVSVFDRWGFSWRKHNNVAKKRNWLIVTALDISVPGEFERWQAARWWLRRRARRLFDVDQTYWRERHHAGARHEARTPRAAMCDESQPLFRRTTQFSTALGFLSPLFSQTWHKFGIVLKITFT